MVAYYASLAIEIPTKIIAKAKQTKAKIARRAHKPILMIKLARAGATVTPRITRTTKPNTRTHTPLPAVLGGPALQLSRANTITPRPAPHHGPRSVPRPLSSERDGGRGHALPTTKTTSGSDHAVMGSPPMPPRAPTPGPKRHTHPG